MSYCRFHWGGSDVYIFESVNGPSLECCGCRLAENQPEQGGQWNWRDVPAFLEHINEHLMEGHFVPPGVARDVWEDWRDGKFEWAEPFDPSSPEPPEVHQEVHRWWRDRVTRHMYKDKPPEFIELMREIAEGTHFTRQELADRLGLENDEASD